MSARGPKVVPLHPRRRAGGDSTAGEDPAKAELLTIDEAIGRNLDSLYAIARMLTGTRAAAEDLVQETALAAFRAWGSLRQPGAVKTWLFRILYRAHLNHRRREKRRPALVDLDIDELLDHPILGREPELPGLEAELSEDVAEALAALPDGFRETVWMIDVEELTIAETAEVLDVPPGTIASRVYRARRMLRETLAKKPRGGAQ